MPIDDADIRWLLSLAEAEDLAELEVRSEAGEVLVVRRHDAPTALAGAPGPDERLHAADLEPDLPDNIIPILAPMSGVFYRAPSPESPPYAQVGQAVEQGDIVGLIEAMKLFNDITAHVSGVVHEVLVESETAVEVGRPLVLIET